MRGSVGIVLHAHLPFVRHPEHTRSLEESWLYEAITDCYIPLLQVLEGWARDGIQARLAMSLTPTLTFMLQDPFLQERYRAHLDRLINLAEAELTRTHWQPQFHELAGYYLDWLRSIRAWYKACQGDLISAVKKLQQSGQLELLASSATHAVLPLMRDRPGSLRAQIDTGCDAHAACFGSRPSGFWLPECAWAAELEPVLLQAGVKWVVTDSHALLKADPPARYGLFAPVITPDGIAVFARDNASARQVWSRDEGYPGDPWYRDFYSDVGFELDLDYLDEFLPVRGRRGFTGLKYRRITGHNLAKEPYDRQAALARVHEHAKHFLHSRANQLSRLEKLMDHAIILCPYDAELFGHWWFEGPEFIDSVGRQAHAEGIHLVTPGDYLRSWPDHQCAMPADSSWGEKGYWHVWLNEKNHWVTAKLAFAEERMQIVAREVAGMSAVERRALVQAGRELLLAQASDWPFIIRTGTSPEYAARRVRAHLLRFWKLCDQLGVRTSRTNRNVNETELAKLESLDALFPDLNVDFWRDPAPAVQKRPHRSTLRT